MRTWMGPGTKMRETAQSARGRKAVGFSGLTYITSYYKIDREKSSLFSPPGDASGPVWRGSERERGSVRDGKLLDRAPPAGYPLRGNRFVYLFVEVLV
jgi:hypothetical protein